MEKVINCDKNGQHSGAITLRSLINDGVRDGIVKPLPRKIFNYDQAEEAFRFMATGLHIGKILIKMGDENNNLDTNINIVTSRERVYFDPMKCYIVIGGLGGIGLEICHWLVTKGVRNLVITSRTGMKSDYHKFMIHLMEHFGAKVYIETFDASEYNQAKDLIEYSQTIAPVGGIFNIAMVLKDALFMNQTKESFEECCNIKIKGTYNLDQISRKICPELEHFVCFSSLASTIGNVGQSNYGFANSFMDNLCIKRRIDGFPSLSLAWGAVGDVGHVAEKLGHDVVVGGTIPQRINSVIDIVECFLHSKDPVIDCILKSNKIAHEVKGDILGTILNVLGIKDRSKINPQSTLADLGIDSLMAMEIKQLIERYSNKIMSAKEIREMSIEQIQNISNTKIKNHEILEVKDIMNDVMNIDLNVSKSVFAPLFNNESKLDPIFIFPAIEGLFSQLNPMLVELSMKTKRPLIAVNWVKECDDMISIEELALFYLEHILKAYPHVDSYDMIPYSFGTMIALEISYIIQRNKRLSEDEENIKNSLNDIKRCNGIAQRKVIKVGNIIILDSSPSYAKPYLTTKHMTNSSNENENAWFEKVSNYSLNLIKNGSKSWDDKVTEIPEDDSRFRKWINLIKRSSKNKWAEQDFIDVIDRARRKFKMILDYNPSEKLEMNIKLIRASIGYNPEVDRTMAHDYDLSKIISGKVDVIKLDGDHKSFLTINKERIANEIIAQIECK